MAEDLLLKLASASLQELSAVRCELRTLSDKVSKLDTAVESLRGQNEQAEDTQAPARDSACKRPPSDQRLTTGLADVCQVKDPSLRDALLLQSQSARFFIELRTLRTSTPVLSELTEGDFWKCIATSWRQGEILLTVVRRSTGEGGTELVHVEDTGEIQAMLDDGIAKSTAERIILVSPIFACLCPELLEATVRSCANERLSITLDLLQSVTRQLVLNGTKITDIDLMSNLSVREPGFGIRPVPGGQVQVSYGGDPNRTAPLPRFAVEQEEWVRQQAKSGNQDSVELCSMLDLVSSFSRLLHFLQEGMARLTPVVLAEILRVQGAFDAFQVQPPSSVAVSGGAIAWAVDAASRPPAALPQQKPSSFPLQQPQQSASLQQQEQRIPAAQQPTPEVQRQIPQVLSQLAAIQQQRQLQQPSQDQQQPGLQPQQPPLQQHPLLLQQQPDYPPGMGCGGPSNAVKAETGASVPADQSLPLERLHSNKSASVATDGGDDIGENDGGEEDGINAETGAMDADLSTKSLPVLEAQAAFLECFREELAGDRALLLSQLNNLYKMRSGEELPYKDCGYDRLRDFLLDIPGLALLGRGNRLQVKVNNVDLFQDFKDKCERTLAAADGKGNPHAPRFHMPAPPPPALQQKIKELFMAAPDNEVPLRKFVNMWHAQFPSEQLAYRSLGYRDLRGLLSSVPFIEKVGGKSDAKYVLRPGHCQQQDLAGQRSGSSSATPWTAPAQVGAQASAARTAQPCPQTQLAAPQPQQGELLQQPALSQAPIMPGLVRPPSLQQAAGSGCLQGVPDLSGRSGLPLGFPGVGQDALTGAMPRQGAPMTAEMAAALAGPPQAQLGQSMCGCGQGSGSCATWRRPPPGSMPMPREEGGACPAGDPRQQVSLADANNLWLDQRGPMTLMERGPPASSSGVASGSMSSLAPSLNGGMGLSRGAVMGVEPAWRGAAQLPPFHGMGMQPSLADPGSACSRQPSDTTEMSTQSSTLAPLDQVKKTVEDPDDFSPVDMLSDLPKTVFGLADGLVVSRRGDKRPKKVPPYFMSSPGAVSSETRDASIHQGKFDLPSILQGQLSWDVACLACDISTGKVMVANNKCEDLFESGNATTQLTERDIFSLVHQDDREKFSAHIAYLTVSERAWMDEYQVRVLTLLGATRLVSMKGNRFIGAWWQFSFACLDQDSTSS